MSIAERLARSDRPDIRTEVSHRVQQGLVESLGPRLYDSSVSETDLRDLVRRKVRELLEIEQVPLSLQDKMEMGRKIEDSILGLGPLEEFVGDAEVTEIMVNGYDSIFVEREGKLFKTDERFVDDNQLRRIIEKIVAAVGRRIDESSPYVDARLSDGSRVNAIIPPLAVDGPALTIRKFSAEPYTTDDLVSFGSITKQAAEFLRACVEGRINVLVSGGTGAGKTTSLNVLSSFIPADERIITIEDAAELKLQQPHFVRLEARPANIEGAGEVTIRQLVRNALRMRPDRIVVGEVRGGEALDMLQAMNTGHDGSISTIHANSPRDVMSRLETMVLMAGTELTVRAVREQVASAVDLVIQQSRLKDGTRRITHITEVVGMEGDVITLQDLFSFDFAAGMDASGRFKGELKPTGIRPHFVHKLEDAGIKIPASTFMTEAGSWTR